MSITKHIIEHEFLARWDENGNLQGCHIAYRESMREDGAEIASKFLDPLPVGLEDADKLAEIGAAINASALAEVEGKTVALAAMKAERDAARQERDDKLAELTAAGEQIAALQAELEALKGSAAINGVPQIVSRFQARAALLGAGLLGTIETMMAGPDVPPLMKMAWTDAATFERQSPTLLALAAQLGLDDTALDALFVQAAEIKA